MIPPTKINSVLTLIGISTALLIFAIIIGGYYMLTTKAKVDEFLKRWEIRQNQDNIRFNATLETLGKTYNLIVGNQRLIINLSDFGSHNSQANLNLTKLNRATLTDSNHILRQLAKYLNLENATR